jgi:hypothetical protein
VLPVCHIKENSMRRTASVLIVCLTALLANGCRFHGFDDTYDGDDSRKTIVRLNGTWKFAVGDAMERAQPEFNDSTWASIHAPETWQSEGYSDYHGYAWYRKSFTFPKGFEGKSIFLSLGRVDDVDQVYINGRLIGTTGQFPPNYMTAYNRNRVYAVPAACLKPGEQNLIAVRIFDEGGVGGIYRGNLRLYASDTPQPVIKLEGTWQFHPGDNPKWKEEHIEDKDFAQIQVPANWEHQGYPSLDGFAWYRITFTAPGKLSDTTAVLLLGKIDDIDEAYLNGRLIGTTGNFQNLNREFYEQTSPYNQSRAYFFPASLLKETNTLAVRVYDLGGDGGIYAGPLGIMSQTEYAKYWEIKREENRHWLRRLVEGE